MVSMGKYGPLSGKSEWSKKPQERQTYWRWAACSDRRRRLGLVLLRRNEEFLADGQPVPIYAWIGVFDLLLGHLDIFAFQLRDDAQQRVVFSHRVFIAVLSLFARGWGRGGGMVRLRCSRSAR